MAFQGPPAFASWNQVELARNAAPRSAVIPGSVMGLLPLAVASNEHHQQCRRVVPRRRRTVGAAAARDGQGRAGQGRVQGFPGPLALCTRADEVISIKSSVLGKGGGGERSTGAGLGWAGLAGLAPLLHLDVSKMSDCVRRYVRRWLADGGVVPPPVLGKPL